MKSSISIVTAYLVANFLLESNTIMSKQPVVDLVDLIPFDVQFALTVNLDISIFEVTDIVSEWMSDVFRDQLVEWGYTAEEEYAIFNRVILYDRQVRTLQEVEEVTPALRGDRNLAQGFLYTARMGGHAAFSFSEEQSLPVPVADILEIQRRTLQNRTAMLTLQSELQQSDPDGLGASLVALQSYLNPNDVGRSSGQESTDDLEMVIVIAVGVACAAFLFLILAVIWAWRYDRRNRQAYLNSKAGRTGSDTTFDDDGVRTTPNSSPRQDFPAVVDAADHYPDSVITDDIATSLSLYYQSGMANAMNGQGRRNMGDAASVSSMESYGFSLDGYSPSVATPMPSDMPRAMLQKKQQEEENEDEDEESAVEEQEQPQEDDDEESAKDQESVNDEESAKNDVTPANEEASAFGDISTVYGEGGKPEF